jgi:hypothetical protein
VAADPYNAAWTLSVLCKTLHRANTSAKAPEHYALREFVDVKHLCCEDFAIGLSRLPYGRKIAAPYGLDEFRSGYDIAGDPMHVLPDLFCKDLDLYRQPPFLEWIDHHIFAL